MSALLQKTPYYLKKPSQFTNQDVVHIIKDYKQWLFNADEHTTWSKFCYTVGIRNPQYLRDYLFRKFTGLNGRVDFGILWMEAERMREDKLIELGLFNKKVNASFLVSLMKARFGWSDDTIMVGVSVEDIMKAKRQAEVLIQ